MKAIIFTICLSVGLIGFSTGAYAQQEARQGEPTSAKKEKVKKAGTESNEVISTSPMSASKKRTVQRPASTAAPASSGSVMSAGKSPRDAK